MKILCIKDKTLSDILDIFDYIKDSYEGVTPVEWEVEEIDASELPWEVYYGDSKGLSKSYVKAKTKEIWERKLYSVDHVVWAFSEENWGAPGIGGWNLGKLYNNYSVQLLKAEQAGKWAGLTLGMEVCHSWDELSPIELGISLNKKFDFDSVVAHGEHHDWGVLQEDGTYFTDYDYTKAIEHYAPIISAIYEERRRKEQEQLKLLEKIVIILKSIIQSLGAEPSPAPLEGYKHNHKHHA